MSTKTVNIVGYAKESNQFVVKAQNFDVRISKNEQFPELEGPSPLEYVLAGYAGCINAVGKLVAKEQGIVLKSLQVEISGTLSLDKYQGKISDERAGFKTIEVTVRPTSDATLEQLKDWLIEVENRCPIQDNLLRPTPVSVVLFKEFLTTEAA
ncbi:OsmC family protein [Flavobacterium sp. J49]|uniref:OsmC family protein n=1 Tax=Flavobacterium sp. J49 TaxID=2718534 RepID=UPI0015934343|nr:OsmC family protein [Flavobacterium sp. J49]MBF6641891.1 OsmC family protein [Flavobacterium sp. J49]NIC03138.1 OsmC family protein [Flavobacterium sp. J49]